MHGWPNGGNQNQMVRHSRLGMCRWVDLNSLLLGMGTEHPTLTNRESPTELGWWVYPLLYGYNGSLDPIAHILISYWCGSSCFQHAPKNVPHLNFKGRLPSWLTTNFSTGSTWYHLSLAVCTAPTFLQGFQFSSSLPEPSAVWSPSATTTTTTTTTTSTTTTTTTLKLCFSLWQLFGLKTKSNNETQIEEFMYILMVNW